MDNQKGIREIIETNGAIFFAAVVLFYFLVWPSIAGHKIASYPAMRNEAGELIPLNRTIYKVNSLTHTIIYWMPGIDETPKRLVNCAVRNRKNWIGYYYDGSSSVEMRKGKIVTESSSHFYVGRWRWWLTNIFDKI